MASSSSFSSASFPVPSVHATVNDDDNDSYNTTFTTTNNNINTIMSSAPPHDHDEYNNDPGMDLFADFNTTTGFEALMDDIAMDGTFDGSTPMLFDDPNNNNNANHSMSLEGQDLFAQLEPQLELSSETSTIRPVNDLQQQQQQQLQMQPQNPSASPVTITAPVPQMAPPPPQTASQDHTTTDLPNTTTAPATAAPGTATTPLPTPPATTAPAPAKPAAAPNSRKRIPPEKTLILETFFQNNPKPDREARDRLAKQTGLPIRNIQVSTTFTRFL